MRIRLVHLVSTIRANLVAFCSIALFVALGAGLFLGIGWSAESLRRSVGETFEAGAVHDVEVQFPAGLTVEDVEAIGSVEGVEAAEGRYQTHVVMTQGAGTYTVRVTSLTDDIDRVRLVSGSLPTREGEVALQRSLAERAGISLGDVLVVDGAATADEVAGAVAAGEPGTSEAVGGSTEAEAAAVNDALGAPDGVASEEGQDGGAQAA